MPDSQAHTPHHDGLGRRAARGLWHVVLGIAKRIWALALIALVLWLSYRAVDYLVTALLRPTEAPSQIVEIPRELDAAMLQRPRWAFAGVKATENPRTPPAHYHRIDNWFQPDRFNDCTRTGCHAPLPHGRNKADRAFLNMHATSLHCGVCHLQSDQTPLPLTWYSLESGAPAEPPALLRAYAWLLDFDSAEPATSAAQDEIVDLLREAAEVAGAEPQLLGLADHLAAVRPESDSFTRLVERARAIVPRHFRGEYGEKLALRDAQGDPILGHPGAEPLIDEFLDRRESLTQAELDEWETRIHSHRRPATLVCTDCHTQANSLVDLTRVGYPPARVRALYESWVFRMIEHMMEGRPFHLPELVLPESQTKPAEAP